MDMTLNPQQRPDPTPEQLAMAKRWMSSLPRDQFDLLLVLIRECENILNEHLKDQP